MNTPILTLALLAATAGLGSAAVRASTAPDRDAGDSVTSHDIVRYRDLNLSSDTGAERLYRRLDRAAARVCGDNPFDPAYMRLWQSVRSCETGALGRAVAQVDSPKLTAIYDQHAGGAAAGRAARVGPVEGSATPG